MPQKQVSPARNYWVILTVALLLFAVDHFRLIDFHELDAVDLRLMIRGAQPAHSKVVIVEIDDGSIRAIGQWPWPRSVHAVLLGALARYEPRVVFYDVLFTEGSVDPSEDEKLAFAAEKAARVIFPFYYHSVKPLAAFFPIKPLRESAWGMGYVNIHPDPDGRVRRIRAWFDTTEERYYHTSMMMALSQFVDEEKAEEWLKTIPRDSNGEFWINFPGPASSFKRISFGEVIATVDSEDDSKMAELFRDSVVLVGHTGTGSTDLLSTPFSTVYPGVTVQASAVHTLLSGKFLRSPNSVLGFFIVVLLSLSVAWLTKVFGPKRALIFVPSLMALYVAWNILVFHFMGFILPFFVPVIAMGISYVLTLFLEYTEIRFQGELIGRELSTAARIQETFLPQAEPKIENLDVAFECRFAKQVGGDLYDWIDFGEGRFGMCVGDVSGKGVPAAIYMARVISDFRRENKSELAPHEVCNALNQLLARDGASGMFLTLIYVVVDTYQKKLRFANAGHEPMILYHYQEKKAEILEGLRGKPLGLFMEEQYQTMELPFHEGDLFLLLSDGVKELRNPKNQEFGLERLREFMNENGADHATARQVLHHLFRDMKNYRKSTPPHDDRTLVCVKFGSPF